MRIKTKAGRLAFLTGGAVLAAVLIAFAVIALQAIPFLRYPDARAASPFRVPATVQDVRREPNPLSGVNFGLGLMGDREGDWGVVFQESDFDAARDAGFKRIRIQVQFLPHLREEGGSYSIDPAFLSRLDWAIGEVLERDMIAIVDPYRIIPDEQLSFRSRSEREGVEARFLAIWEWLAERYRDYPEALHFELANEPHRPLGGKAWSALARRAIAIIRSEGGGDAARTIVVGVPIRISPVFHTWDQVYGVEDLDLPSADEDPALMITFHYYNPYPFSHQGQTYTPGLARSSWMWMGNTWTDTEAQIAFVRRDFDAVARWAEEHRRAVLLGEFGASVLADLESQVRWTARVREEAEARGMAWTFWDFFRTDGLGSLYDQKTGAWRAEILDALAPPGADDLAREAALVRGLAASLSDPEWKERRKAAEALSSRGPLAAEAVPALIRALADEEWQVRFAAVRSLGAIGSASTEAIPALTGALADAEWQVRNAAAMTLSAFGPSSREAVPALTAALRDPEWQLRESSAIALGAIGPDARPAIAGLIALHGDGEWKPRRAAANAIASISPGDGEARAALKPLLRDPEPLVREATRDALRRKPPRRSSR